MTNYKRLLLKKHIFLDSSTALVAFGNIKKTATTLWGAHCEMWLWTTFLKSLDQNKNRKKRAHEMGRVPHEIRGVTLSGY